MRRRYLAIFFVHLLLAVSVSARPMTWKEIGLMLRSGYSSDTVTREAATRHVIEPLDPASEKMLVQAGAEPALIAAFKTGSFGISPEEAAKAKDQLQADAARRVAQAAESKKFNTLYQAEQARARAAAPVIAGRNVIHDAIKGDLVQVSRGTIDHYDDAPLAHKKLFAIYFSAHWCPPCRKFTPQLVDYYNRVAPLHPDFDLIFFSLDHTQFEMDTYMKEDKMPWPAVRYTQREGKELLKKLAGKSIPCLVLVDSDGNVVSTSETGDQYLGPGKVLADLDNLLAKSSVAQLAPLR
jgi:nucleoredoxin